MSEKSSRLPGFFKLSVEERTNAVGDWAKLDEEERAGLLSQGLSARQADMMIENVVGTYEMPIGIAANFLINGRDYLVPMAIEEPSVVAAASNMAKVVRAGGGFQTETTDPVMIGQIQVLDIPDMDAAITAIKASRQKLMDIADDCDPVILRFGGGARDIEVRPFPDTPVGPMLIIHLLYDARDAMGANTVNTAVERMAPVVADLTGGRTCLRILSNLADHRTATARCTIPADELSCYGKSGQEVARLIEEANSFALVDPYRAATHNKGIMNGIDAVCIATGNDWRAIEAGAHAYAARDGHYRALTDWHVDENGDLYGELTLPMAVGIVGGATKVHPTAQTACKILGVESAAELAQVIVAVGLAQNLGAIKALSTVGIQRGHMRLHARQVALAAGAKDGQVQWLADKLVDENNIYVERAKELLQTLDE
jgi:hydroxymethylglutaryl-CoA reductase